MTKNYRSGAIGALLDEYERAIADLKHVITIVDNDLLVAIIDPHTTDDYGKTIQAILSHVVHSGYGYATSIHNHKGNQLVRQEMKRHATVPDYLQDLTDLFSFTEDVFKAIKEDDLEQLDESLKIKTGWGQHYDVEQLTEHAIVHILRHRRQIERLLQDYRA